jgi:hypothetical protein
MAIFARIRMAPNSQFAGSSTEEPTMLAHRLIVPAFAAALVATLATTSPAHAEEVIEHGYYPNKPLIASGFITFGIPYTVSVFVGATSNREEDRALFIPLVGPWIDLATRGGCPPLAANCNGETAAKAGLIVDGIFQGIGVITMASGFLWRSKSYTVVRSAGIDMVAPWSTGSGGGLAAIGHF